MLKRKLIRKKGSFIKMQVIIQDAIKKERQYVEKTTKRKIQTNKEDKEGE